jgi:Tol biopolymer transport system component
VRVYQRRAFGLVVVAAAAAMAMSSGWVHVGRASDAVLSAHRYLLVGSIVPAGMTVYEVLGGSGGVLRVIEPASHEPWSRPRWSPDGSMIAWAPSAGVVIERADGRSRRVLVATVKGCRTYCQFPMTFGWSPDGTHLVVGGVGKQTDLLVTAAVATGRTKVVAAVHKNVTYRVVGWSPDGSSIAYIREPGFRCCQQLVVAEADGSRARVLVSFRDFHDSPAASWSPDGRSIAFTDEGRDPHDPPFAVVDVATSAVHAITGLGLKNYLEFPVWSPDSKRLAVAQYKAPAVTLDAATGTDVQSLKATGTQVIWNRQGDLLVVNGIAHGSVSQSPDGRMDALPIFRLPKNITDITLDAS